LSGQLQPPLIKIIGRVCRSAYYYEQLTAPGKPGALFVRAFLRSAVYLVVSLLNAFFFEKFGGASATSL
jgi:hypothetical protein